MSIKNEAKIKNPLIVAIREQLEHRALWMYLLCGHAMCGDRGIAESFGCCLELPSTIARGDDLCRIRFVRKKKAFYPAAQYQLEGIYLSTRFGAPKQLCKMYI